jgi:hypothetical protein
MSQKSVSQIIGRALVERAFRRSLEANPAKALAGYDLTADELSLIRSSLQTGKTSGPAGDLEPRVSRARLPLDALSGLMDSISAHADNSPGLATTPVSGAESAAGASVQVLDEGDGAGTGDVEGQGGGAEAGAGEIGAVDAGAEGQAGATVEVVNEGGNAGAGVVEINEGGDGGAVDTEGLGGFYGGGSTDGSSGLAGEGGMS